MCYVCRNHKLVISSCKTDNWDCSKNKTTSATGGERTINPSCDLSSHRCFFRIRITQSLAFLRIAFQIIVCYLSFFFRPFYLLSSYIAFNKLRINNYTKQIMYINHGCGRRGGFDRIIFGFTATCTISI